MRFRLPQARVAEAAVHEQHRGPIAFRLDPEAGTVYIDVRHACDDSLRAR